MYKEERVAQELGGAGLPGLSKPAAESLGRGVGVTAALSHVVQHPHEGIAPPFSVKEGVAG